MRPRTREHLVHSSSRTCICLSGGRHLRRNQEYGYTIIPSQSPPIHSSIQRTSSKKSSRIPEHNNSGDLSALLHDPATYGEDVDQFRPERFLNPDGTLNDAIPYPNAAFGFGRRVCAGKTFVQSALWVTVASLLSCFDFSTALDKNGDEIHPSTNYRGLAISEPQPFECVIRPRSKVVAELIRQIQRRE